MVSVVSVVSMVSSYNVFSDIPDTVVVSVDCSKTRSRLNIRYSRLVSVSTRPIYSKQTQIFYFEIKIPATVDVSFVRNNLIRGIGKSIRTTFDIHYVIL